MLIEVYNNFLHVLVEYQYTFNKLISSTIKSINNENSMTLSLSLLGIAFIYGLVHAAGPGHGKSLVAFYFASNKNDYKKAFQVGFLISVIHAISALFLTFGIFFLLKTMFRKHFNDFSEITMMFSAVLIILIGFYLIWHAYKHKKDKEENLSQKSKNIYMLSLSVGIVPCPGVMTIVLFCIMLGHLTLGIFSAIAMSIGMGLTISIAGIFAIALNKKTSGVLGIKAYIFEIIGAILVLILGIFLLLTSLNRLA